MNDDLLPVLKAAEELEPALQVFAEATDLTAPLRELAGVVTALVRYGVRVPIQAKLLMAAAAKVKATGLRPSAVSDKLLRAVLEDGAMEDDPEMQERWANLLANASTRPPRVRAAFPRILRELDPADANLLDLITDGVPTHTSDGRGYGRGQLVSLENLARLGLITPPKDEFRGGVYSADRTALGLAFVAACRPPYADA